MHKRKVKCISIEPTIDCDGLNTNPQGLSLTVGKIYNVVKEDSVAYYVYNDKNELQPYHYHRFKIVRSDG